MPDVLAPPTGLVRGRSDPDANGTHHASSRLCGNPLELFGNLSVHVGMTKVIDQTTIYTGDEIPGLKGQQVRIFGVMRGALLPGTNVDADDYFVTNDAALREHGGVTKHDRVDVAHLHADGRASFVHCDPRAIDLQCFAHLRNQAASPRPTTAGRSNERR